MSSHDTELPVFDGPLDGVQLIEASAGTGKTWNLSALVVRLVVEKGLSIDRILVVTFTTAATAELRERIRTRLADTLRHLAQGDPAPEDPFVTPLREAWHRAGIYEACAQRRIEGALLNFDEASIFTIHGFCQRALADTPVAAGMPVSSALMADDLPLRLQVAGDFWRQHVAAAPIGPVLAGALRRHKDSPLRWAALLKARLDKPLSRVVWTETDDAPALDLKALQLLFDQARALWQRERERILDCVLASRSSLHKGHYSEAALQQARDDWQRMLDAGDALQAPAQVGDRKKASLLGSARLKPGKGKPPPRHHDFFALAQALLDAWGAAERAGEAGRHRLLRQLLEDGPQAVRERRRQLRAITYDDMLYKLHERLSGAGGEAYAQRLRERFVAALIDEFQDTDPLQWSLFSRLWGHGAAPLFLVGDPKQAIYGFRNADLATYLAARSTASRRHWLGDNQRADEPLVRAVNALFGAHEAAFMRDGLTFQPVRFGRKRRPDFQDASGVHPPLQLWELPASDGQPPSRNQALAMSAEACAAEIARLLREGHAGRITRDGQPLGGGDIAVLVRSHAQGRRMREALQRLGVDSVELSQASVFATPDAQELSALLRAVLEPTHEGVVRAALSTSLIGLDAAAVLALDEDPAALPDRMARFAACRETWQRAGVAAMWRQLSLGEGVRERLLARPDGPRRMTNVLHLVEFLHGASQTLASPAEVLRWLEERRTQARSADEAEQLRLETDRQLVQVVTIHRAKGLEYGLVFCPFLWDGHRSTAKDPWRSSHDAEGQPTLHFDGLQDEALKARLLRDSAEEDVRLLYVALTRAVHRCHVVTGLYAGKNRQTASKESLKAILHWLAAGGSTTAQRWLQSDEAALSGEEITAAWHALAVAHPSDIALRPLHLPQDEPAAVTADEQAKPGSTAATDSAQPLPDIQARTAPARLPRGLWLGSYSRLVHGARSEDIAPDHDDRVDVIQAAPGRAARLDGSDDILDFPRGPDAGHCLHAAFEAADFTQPEGWDAAIAQALRTKAPRLDGLTMEQAHAMLRRMLGDVLSTPLGDGLRLDHVPRARCRAEFEFTLPAGALDTVALRAALSEHGYAAPVLQAATLQGMLRGFIDLVLEDQGRWFVVDWKSNHLGRTPKEYAAAELEQEMARHHYPLQALLYTVALHRHLAWRVPGYDYERHVGGVRYLFVRGVRPGWQDEDGSATGVWSTRPPRALIERLDRLFSATEMLA